MAEYIERKALLKRFEQAKEWCKKHLGEGKFGEGCIAALEDEIFNITHNIAISTADVVEVVRCKDCEHKKEIHDCQKELYSSSCVACSYHSGLIMDGNDFCSYGERKEGANNG